MSNNFVVLGGIKYRVRIKKDDHAILTLPYGNIEYVAPRNPNTAEYIGLPISKGLKFNR